MTIIGFDVSKQELVGARITKRALLQETIVLENTAPAIVQFLNTAQATHHHLTIASEATAEYHRVLAEHCVARSIPFRLLNPILTKQFTRATIRKRKTDASDALIIAKLALQGEGTLLTPESFHPLKSITRVAHKLVRLERMLVAMKARLERVFPEEITACALLEEPQKALAYAVREMRTYILEGVD